MTNIYPHGTLHMPTRPGTPVPAQWCDMHGLVVTADDLCRNDQGDEWCPAAEADAEQAHCRLLPLVVGS